MNKTRFNFGPGTKLSLVAVAGVCIWQWAIQPKSPSLAELTSRISSEAPKPLHKPEPRELLTADLTPSQRGQVEAISREWEAQKEELNASMKLAAGLKPDRPDLGSLKSSLSEYSALSRIYNQQREAAWARAQKAAGRQAKAEAAS